MVFRPMAFEELRGFGLKDGRLFPEGDQGRRYAPVAACGVVRQAVCCGPTIGLGHVFPGEMVIPPYCPPPAPPAEDQRSLAVAIGKALKQVLRGTVLTTQQSALERPGLKGRRLKTTTIVAVHAGMADTANALFIGWRGPFSGTAINVVNIGGTVPVAIMSFVAPSSMAATVEGVIISSQSIDIGAQILFSCVRSGLTVQPEFRVVEAVERVPLGIQVGADDIFLLMGRMAGGQNGAYLLRIQLDVFLTPLEVKDDTLASRVIMQGSRSIEECV